MPPDRDETPPAPGDNEAFLAWLETVADPERRYTIATSALEQHQEMVSRLSALRAEAVADASEEDSVSSVARRFGVSRQRAYQLLQEAKTREPAAPQDVKRRSSRQKGRRPNE
jgi:transposase-like protein